MMMPVMTLEPLVVVVLLVMRLVRILLLGVTLGIMMLVQLVLMEPPLKLLMEIIPLKLMLERTTSGSAGSNAVKNDLVNE